MLCFRDKSFCNHSRKDCGNTECNRYFTEQDEKDGIEWWGNDNFPVAMMDFKNDDCGFTAVEVNSEKTDIAEDGF